MEVISNPKVQEVFDQYPAVIKEKMLFLRKLVLETAQEAGITQLEETLKWGEPSFLSAKGSTLRMDWKSKKPEQYAMYFQCSTKLVATFRVLFENELEFEANRAIIFKLQQEVPVLTLKKCIKATLLYHSVKQLELLGI